MKRAAYIPDGYLTNSGEAYLRVASLLEKYRYLNNFLDVFRRAVDNYMGEDVFINIDVTYENGNKKHLHLILVCPCEEDLAVEMYDKFDAEWFQWRGPEWIMQDDGLGCSMGLSLCKE